MMTRSPMRGRIAVAVAALVLLGATVGIAADRLLNAPTPAHAARLSDGTMIRISDTHPTPSEAIIRALDLRPEQRTRIAAIIERRQSDLDATWHEAQARILGTVDGLITEITAELDPEQAERFRTLHDEVYGPMDGEHPRPH